ncbi:hypothetical protein QJS83_16955 [Bdellovibrio sp. 22V]|uniref:hypothetical protein n=1 Tax=Bdellovibrio sp. 22V TaxID=3044166 RepID=UPI0025435CDF|nr:hypothetical protein [Bdellovibrio sp. 22V]WII72154.1 hypothetical protein QJS83_16955 [Bdellovibrio sp. 22V]
MKVKYKPPRKRFFTKTKKNCSFRLPEDLLSYYDKLAKESGMTLTDLVADVLDSAAEQLEKGRQRK